MHVPQVSVLMPVYNGMPYLPLAVESILTQHFTDFEFIIVNDCSTDNSLEYLLGLKDRRVVLVNLKENLGITGALQKGIKVARGNYIARLDADDIALPERLGKQVLFFEENQRYGLIGTSFISIDDEGNPIAIRQEFTDDLEVRWKMLFKSPLTHATVMFRKSILDQHNLTYDQLHAEDYHLWNNFMKFTEGCILKEPLIHYRVHNQSWTHTKKSQQVQARQTLSFHLINEVFSKAQQEILTFEKYVEFIDWRRTGKGGASNAKIELRLLDSFSFVYKSHIQLKSLRKKITRGTLNKVRKDVVFDPSLWFVLIKNLFV